MADVTTNQFKYSLGIVPGGYQCGTCKKRGCKLWREYNTFLNHQALYCCDYAGKNQKKDISQIDERGKIPDPDLGGYGSDQIGWLVPAVPTQDGTTYWGYTSVPQDGCDWWYGLPTRV
jgi:hypothetical protein